MVLGLSEMARQLACGDLVKFRTSACIQTVRDYVETRCMGISGDYSSRIDVHIRRANQATDVKDFVHTLPLLFFSFFVGFPVNCAIQVACTRAR